MNENEKAPVSLNPEDQPITGIKQQEHNKQFNPDEGIVGAANLPIMPPLPKPINIKLNSDKVQPSQLDYNIPQNAVQDEVTFVPYGLDADGLSETDREFYAGIATADNCPSRDDDYDPDVMEYYHQEAAQTIAINEVNVESKPDVNKTDYGITEEFGQYALNGKQISNCLIQVECIYEPSNYVALSFTKADGYSVKRRLAPNDFNSNTKLNAAIKDPRITFNATDKEIRVLKEYIFSKQFKTIYELERIGFSEINNAVYFADANSIIDMNNSKAIGIMLSEGHEGIKSNILSYDNITNAELSYIQGALLGFNSVKNVLSVLGTCCSFFLKERLKSFNVKVPILNIYGQSGAGKSTTIDFVIRQMFCIPDSYKASDIKEATVFSMVKEISSSNIIPFIGDEYKPALISKQKLNDISGMLRNTYDGNLVKRGTSNQSVIVYPLSSPVIIAGEQGFSETALINRSIIVNFGINDRTSNTDYYMEMLRLNKNLLHKLGRSLLNEAICISDNELFTLYNNALPFYKASITNDRIAINMAVCSVGLFLLNRVFGKLNLYPISTVLNIAPEAIGNQLLISAHSEMATKNGTSISVIDRTIEVIDVMIGEGELVENVDYKIVDGDSERLLALRLPNLYPKFIKFIGPRYRSLEIISEEEQFKKLIKDTPYFVINNHAVRIDGTSKKCCCLSCAKLLISSMDIPNLLGMF